MSETFRFRERRSLRGHFCQVLLLGAAVVFSLIALSELIADDKPVTVTIKCPALAGKSGAKVRVLEATVLGIIPSRAYSARGLDGYGECRFELDPGEYGFEVMLLEGDTIFALRAAPKRISRDSLVELKGGESQPVTVTSSLEQTLNIDELAVRSAAVTGEIEWKVRGSAVPRLILTPGQSYRVRALGGNDDVHFAIWQELSTKKSAILLDQDVSRGKFNIRTDGPNVESARVRFLFPDSEIKFPVKDDTLFITNRKFVSAGYAMDLSGGRRVVLRPWLGMLKEKQDFRLGGPFTTAAWAGIMPRKPINEPETHHLVWGANLYDAQGHMVMPEQSEIQWQRSIHTQSGAAAPIGKPLTKEEIDSLRAKLDPLVIEVNYVLDKYVSASLPPQRFVPYGSRRFHTRAPPHWEVQALNYVSKAERVFHIIEDLENKPSKHRVEVRWHAMNGTAWGCAPAGGNAYIMMPFGELQGSFNFYDAPWALGHEMLHTFGYPHGDRMGEMSSLVSTRFEQYRWFMADHPQLDPEAAFVAFRIAIGIDKSSHPNLPAKAAKSDKKKKK